MLLKKLRVEVCMVQVASAISKIQYTEDAPFGALVVVNYRDEKKLNVDGSSRRIVHRPTPAILEL